MRISFYPAVVLTAMIVAGCARNEVPEPVFQPLAGPSAVTPAAKPEPVAKPKEQPVPAAPKVEKTKVQPPVETVASKPAIAQPSPVQTITIVQGLKGRIASANTDLKFVVITFPVGQMARVDQRLNVYREGNKVGELNVTGPPLDDSIVADITAGEAKVGDEVRDK